MNWFEVFMFERSIWNREMISIHILHPATYYREKRAIERMKRRLEKMKESL